MLEQVVVRSPDWPPVSDGDHAKFRQEKKGYAVTYILNCSLPGQVVVGVLTASGSDDGLASSKQKNA